MPMLPRRAGWPLVWACLAVVNGANDWQAYKIWLQNERGYAFSTVDVIEDDNGYRRLIAKKEIKDNNLIVKLPFKSAFTAETVPLTLEGIGCDNEKLENLDPRAAFIVRVLMEKSADDSVWKPFLDKLKSEIDVPSSWGPSDLALLRGSGLLLQVKRDKELLMREYKNFAEECPQWAEKFSRQEFLLAGGLVGATAQTVAEGEAILPFVDLANHDEIPNAELAAVEDEQIFVLVSTRNIREGEEITIKYSDDPGSQSTFLLHGFMSDVVKKIPRKGAIILPGCIPPSLFNIAEETRQEKGESFEGFSPELNHCCEGEDSNKAKGADDKWCYGSRISDPHHLRSFTFNLGPIMPDGTQSKFLPTDKDSSLGELFHRLRTLVADSGIVKGCDNADPNIEKPINMASELRVMRLFKSLLRAHLDHSSWAAGKGGPPPPADTALESHMEIARKALMAERGVFQWYLESIKFVEEYLKLPDTEALQQKLCQDSKANNWGKKVKGKKHQGTAKYPWLVEHVLAPLAFKQKQDKESKAPCGVAQAPLKLKPKDCQAVFKKMDARALPDTTATTTPQEEL